MFEREHFLVVLRAALSEFVVDSLEVFNLLLLLFELSGPFLDDLPLFLLELGLILGKLSLQLSLKVLQILYSLLETLFLVVDAVRSLDIALICGPQLLFQLEEPRVFEMQLLAEFLGGLSEFFTLPFMFVSEFLESFGDFLVLLAEVFNLLLLSLGLTLQLMILFSDFLLESDPTLFLELVLFCLV